MTDDPRKYALRVTLNELTGMHSTRIEVNGCDYHVSSSNRRAVGKSPELYLCMENGAFCTRKINHLESGLGTESIYLFETRGDAEEFARKWGEGPSWLGLTLACWAVVKLIPRTRVVSDGYSIA